MKKLLLLLLCIALILPSVPAFAADRTTVIVSEYNNINDNLIVTVNATSTSFSGATIEVGDSISYEISGTGKGNHTAVIDISQITAAGKTPLRVTAYYGSESDVVEKEIYITKMESAKTEFTKTNLNVTIGLASSGVTNYEALDESEKNLKITYSDVSNADIRLGRSDGDSTYPSGANYLIDFEVMFQNGDSAQQETPGVSFAMILRQSTNAFASGYPYNSSTGESATEASSLKLFYRNGKICETGEAYYTNVWYKVRYEIDSVTKDDNGNLVGGLKLYIAKDEGNGYGDYKLMRNYPYYTLENISQFRFEFKSAAADSSVNFKDISLTRCVPVESWNFVGWGCENDKIDLEFSEDMGEITTSDLKICNKLGDEIAISSITQIDDVNYTIALKNKLIYGDEYDILLANGFKSVAGAIGFEEPELDENGDGLWKVATVKAPKYDLFINDVVDNGNSVSVTFLNNGVSGKHAAVMWFDENDNMVDCCVLAVTIEDDGTQTFERNNAKTAAYFKTMVFGVEADSESENFGADTIYEIK